MKVWLLFEGPYDGDKPGQYEIRRFLEEGAKRGYDVKVFGPSQFDLKCPMIGSNTVWVDSQPQQLPDVVIPRMGVGTTYLGLAVLRHLRRAGVVVLNRAAAVAAVADKLHTFQVLSLEDMPLPKTIFGKCPVDVDLIEKELGFPVVVKTLKGTQGSGVYLSENPENLRDMTGLLTNDGDESLPVVFQEFIKVSAGRDLRVFVVGKKCVACMERSATDGSFKANISRGGVGKNVPITPEMEKLALDVCRILDLEIAGVDLLYNDNGYLICEANSAPDFKGLEKFCNVDIPSVIYDHAANLLGVAKLEVSGNVTPFSRWSKAAKSGLSKIKLFGTR
ncbi:MAG: RimK family alpha-L-glutamate ligase [Micavibrio aeruginosavorus]|uniref:RimK family alpha-L-glutamate ligase n=1 Tax=Micavibrio aeruginosavorus TaxID=349221 RepID=A0A2W5FNQ1_9BACT|nr:MAG: RimK family alpha-L-glutamate ligase [Micavibrio aeruginosavorus]